MRTVALLLLLTFAPQTFAAPAPFRPREAKAAPMAQPAPGRWVMMWSGCKWDVELWGGGAYRGRSSCCIVGGETWTGTWDFNPQTRVLSVCEATESGSVFRWSATLDASLSGRVKSANNGDSDDWRVSFARR